MADMLEEIFRLQGELNRRIGVDTLNMPEDRPEWISELLPGAFSGNR